MVEADSTFASEGGEERQRHQQSVSTPRPSGGGGGLLKQYKASQGTWTRNGTFVGGLVLSIWGGYFLYQRLDVYSGDQWWQLLISSGIPLLFIVVFGGLSWWYSYAYPQSGDFMIATEGEMKKVNWSSKKEVIGSTKVVIVMTLLMAVLLFGVDLIFQFLFKSIGILKIQ